MILNLNHGYRIETFRDPDQPSCWCIWVNHDELPDTGLDTIQHVYRAERTAIGTLVAELLQANWEPDLVPDTMLKYIVHADPEVTLGGRQALDVLMDQYCKQTA